jgi:uncharacterized membrane protein
MLNFWTGMLAGGMLGGTITVFAMACLFVASESDKQDEKLRQL